MFAAEDKSVVSLRVLEELEKSRGKRICVNCVKLMRFYG